MGLDRLAQVEKASRAHTWQAVVVYVRVCAAFVLLVSEGRQRKYTWRLSQQRRHQIRPWRMNVGYVDLGLPLDELILAFDTDTAIDRNLSKTFLILDCDIFRSYHIRDSL